MTEYEELLARIRQDRLHAQALDVHARIETLVKDRDAAIIKSAAWELEVKILRIKLDKVTRQLRTIAEIETCGGLPGVMAWMAREALEGLEAKP
jgi:hypothetical protein